MAEKNEGTAVVSVRKGSLPGMSLVYALYGTRMKGLKDVSYSVTVSVTGAYGSETAAVSDLTRSREEADRIFALLADGTVTPCALKDVLEEIL